jgi:tRNA-specific 2-thiouridylase
MSRVVLAMSGGVDSSVAAHLLQQQGHEVIGVFMRHGSASPVADSPAGGSISSSHEAALDAKADDKQGCCSASDAEDARRVADKLDIPFYALNFDQEFGRIIDYFVDEYIRGRTPNPCIMCNTWLKFGKLFGYADGVGANFVATGHHARIIPADGDGFPRLCRGSDRAKDQSYALFGIKRHLLCRMMLPVGDYEKSRIRQVATELGLRVADKKESQEICFVTSGRHDEFVREQCTDGKSRDGELVTTDGRVVGRHPGIEGFTIGQRKGLGVALGEPHFVVQIDARTRRVVIGKREELARTELTANRANWLVEPPNAPFRCQAKIRYNADAAAATVQALPDGRLKIVFDEPRHGVAPGQAVVCYDDDCVLGGGWIEESLTDAS